MSRLFQRGTRVQLPRTFVSEKGFGDVYIKGGYSVPATSLTNFQQYVIRAFPKLNKITTLPNEEIKFVLGVSGVNGSFIIIFGSESIYTFDKNNLRNIKPQHNLQGEIKAIAGLRHIMVADDIGVYIFPINFQTSEIELTRVAENIAGGARAVAFYNNRYWLVPQVDETAGDRLYFSGVDDPTKWTLPEGGFIRAATASDKVNSFTGFGEYLYAFGDVTIDTYNFRVGNPVGRYLISEIGAKDFIKGHKGIMLVICRDGTVSAVSSTSANPVRISVPGLPLITSSNNYYFYYLGNHFFKMDDFLYESEFRNWTYIGDTFTDNQITFAENIDESPYFFNNSGDIFTFGIEPDNMQLNFPPIQARGFRTFMRDFILYADYLDATAKIRLGYYDSNRLDKIRWREARFVRDRFKAVGLGSFETQRNFILQTENVISVYDAFINTNTRRG